MELLILGSVLIIAVFSCKMTSKTGLPILVGFIFIGMLIGRHFNFVNVSNAEHICNFALLFIIFTGGFQTNFAHAKSAIGVSALMASLGTAITAALAACFAYFVLKFELHASLLLGAVISATDAASVFSILSSKKLRIENSLDSVLEMESGANDPVANIITVVFLAVAGGGSVNVPLMLLMQVAIGAAVGVVIAFLGKRLVNMLNLEIDGLYPALLAGIALLMYGTAGFLQGNGFLAVYIGGMILGNNKLEHKPFLSSIFGSVSTLMQIILFVVLGILWIPLYGHIAATMLPGLFFALVLFFVIRPLMVFILMKPFRYKVRDIALVSWSGFRGASSIVFASYLLSAKLPYAEHVFSIVFFTCLLSVISQGSTLAPLAKKLGLVETE